MSQWKIALKLNHANVLALREVHIDDVYVYMIMDLCDGGELFDRILAKNKNCYSKTLNIELIIFSSMRHLSTKQFMN